jgi:hypothetical protein
MAKSLEQEIQAAKDAIAKTKAAEAKAAKDKEAAAKKAATGRAKEAADARTASQRKKDEALLNSMIATRKKLIQYIADPNTSARDKAAAEANLKGRNGSPSLDDSIAKLGKSLNIAVEGGKIIKRPMSVPSTAVYDPKTKGWTRGKENWDASGKRIGEGAATKTATPPKEPGAGYVTSGGKLLKDGATFSGTYQGKIYKNGVVTGTAPKTETKADTETTVDTTEVVGADVPTTGGTVNTTTIEGINAASGFGDKGTQSTVELTPFDKILAKAKTTYGDVDDIFASDEQLKKLLTDAIGSVEDANDDMTGEEFLRRLKNTDWWGSQAGTVRQRQFEKRQYERLKAKLDPKDPDYQKKLAKLNQEDEYGRGLQDTIDAIKLAADQSGAAMSDDDILAAATELYGLAFENNESRISKKINTFISSQGALKGATGAALQQLRQAATANGFDLETKYAGQIDGWLQQIAAGKSINDFKNIIRDDAGKNQPKYVQDLLRSGYDLDGVYGNYINLIAQTFNIDPNTIKLTDPLLQGVFTDKGGMTFTDFTAKLRTDKRFEGTPAQGGTKDLRQSISDRALALGVTLAEEDLDDITNNALSMGIGGSSSLVDKLIRAKFTYTPGKIIGGAAGGALGELKATAAANGIDFDKQFGSQAQTWLAKILQGEDPNTFKNIIRQTAKLGLPEKVGALLDLGVDLEAIYSPYKNIMASVLEINPQTIGLDDKVLRSAIGPDKEMTIYDWERSLRKDPRWQYTNNARQEVSGITQSVLQDFGMIG